MKQTHYLLLPFFLFISFYAKAQDLSGVWQGVSYIDVFNPRYYIFTLNLKQTGNTINGIGKVEEVGTSYYGIQRISGTVINNVFNFEDIEVIEKNLPSRDTGLCWRKGELIFEPTQERIHGRLESTCFPIRVDLYRLTIKTDTVICSPRSVNIQATGQNLRWYKDSLKQVLVDTGKIINIFVDKTTTIYVTQTVFNTESPSIPITIHLRNDFKNQSYTICQGNSITVGDTIYQTSGVYTKKLVNSYGCDSIILTNLIVNPSYKISNNLNLCTGEKVIVGDTIYQTTGIYTKILKTVLGCDSVITTNLTVNNIKNFKQNKVLCEGQEISVGDTIYRTSGNYLKKLKAFSGCDSLVETNLIIKLNQLTRQNLKICDNQTVTVGDTVYKTSGIYTRKLKTTEGCDSTVITDLTVNPIQQISQKRSICEGESLIVGDTIYRTTGTYTRRLKTLAGCDSLVSTQLSVFPVFKKTQTVSLCEGESLLVGDTVYRTTGIYTRKLRTSAGCDSLITTQLTLNTAKKTEQNIRLCAGKSISVGDTIYRTEGTYTRKLRSAAGCDSLVISYVSVVNEMRFNQKKTICEGSYMTVGDTTYRTTGIYEKRFRSSEGCDSIVTTDLKVINLALQLSPDTLIHLGDSALLMAQINLPVSVSWKWTPSNALHCDTCPTTWAKPIISTQYQIEVKDRETQCYKKGFVIIKTKTDCDLYIPNTFSPNGDNINDKWSIYPSPCIKNIKRVAVFNRWGNLIFEKQNLETQNTASIDVWDGLIKGQLSAMETFIYILEAEYTNGRQVVLGGDVMVMP